MKNRPMPKSGDRFIDSVFDGLGYGCVGCSTNMTTANSKRGARHCNQCLTLPYRCDQCDAPGAMLGTKCHGCSHGHINKRPSRWNTIRCELKARGLWR